VLTGPVSRLDTVPMNPIYLYRLQHELTMEAFGALIGVQKAVVWKWESGHRPSPESAIKIEQATHGAVPRWKLRPDLWARPKVAS
jgi:transcriptional regulator with XRE-family HTH domain